MAIILAEAYRRSAFREATAIAIGQIERYAKTHPTYVKNLREFYSNVEEAVRNNLKVNSVKGRIEDSVWREAEEAASQMFYLFLTNPKGYEKFVKSKQEFERTTKL